jgi:hypothetical protein
MKCVSCRKPVAEADQKELKTYTNGVVPLVSDIGPPPYKIDHHRKCNYCNPKMKEEKNEKEKS